MTEEIVIAVTYSPERDEYLIVRRSEQKSNSGEWEFPSGSIEEDETPEEAALRELEEETGLEGKVEQDGVLEQPPYEFHVFKVEVSYTEVELSWEHDKYNWVNRQQMPNSETADNMGEVLEAVGE